MEPQTIQESQQGICPKKKKTVHPDFGKESYEQKALVH